MNRTKYIPSIIMLAAAFVACLSTIYNKYTTKESLIIILCTIVVFFIIGLFVQMIVDKYLIVEAKNGIEANDNEKNEGDMNEKDNLKDTTNSEEVKSE